MEPYFESGAGLLAVGLGELGWAGLGCGWAGLGCGWAVAGLGWAGWAGWVSNPETEIGLSQIKRKLVYAKMERCVSTEKMSFRMANSNKQFLFISFFSV